MENGKRKGSSLTKKQMEWGTLYLRLAIAALEKKQAGMLSSTSSTQQLQLDYHHSSSHHSPQISEVHGHSAAEQVQSLVHFSLPVLVYSPWLQIPSQVEHSKTGMPSTLHWVQHYSYQWLPERSLFTAEMSAPSSIFGWIQWERDTCALSYVKKRFSVVHRNSTEQEVSQGHWPCCTCCRNILKPCIFSVFLF